MLWVGKNYAQSFLCQVLGVQNYASIPQTTIRHLLSVIIDVRDISNVAKT
jgi:hypothetical protein